MRRDEWSDRLGQRIFDVIRRVDSFPETEYNILPAEPPRAIFGFYFSHRLKPYIRVAFALLSVNYLVFGNTSFHSYGLICNLFGSLIIARGLFQNEATLNIKTKPGSVLRVENENGVFDVPTLHVEVRRSVDAVLGSMFLVLGFALQFMPSTTV